MVGSNRNTVQGFTNDMVGNTNAPTSQSKPSMPGSTLHRISKIVMKEAVRDKMFELIQSDKKTPENDVEVLDLIDTLELHRMINEGINKHYQRDKARRVTNDKLNITNFSTTAHNNDKVTSLRLWLPMLDELMLGSCAGQEEISDLKIRVNNLNEEVQHLQRELRGDVDDDDYVNHDETVPTNNILE